MPYKFTLLNEDLEPEIIIIKQLNTFISLSNNCNYSRCKSLYKCQCWWLRFQGHTFYIHLRMILMITEVRVWSFHLPKPNVSRSPLRNGMTRSFQNYPRLFLKYAKNHLLFASLLKFLATLPPVTSKNGSTHCASYQCQC